MTGQRRKSLLDPELHRDSCGFGLIANLDDLPSHWVVKTAIEALARLTHRGAVAADGKTGDGCGLLIKFPESFLRSIGEEQGFTLARRFAAGTVFLSQDEAKAAAARRTIEKALVGQGLEVAGWRDVPVDPSVCGEQALATMPKFEQVFVNARDTLPRGAFNRKLFLARRRAERLLEDGETYVASLSCVTLSYKGMIMPAALPEFFPDLRDPRMSSSVCVFHQRFSTNTLPQWKLAQPFRFLAHNGEINTIQGNRNWAIARTKNFVSDKLDDISDLDPIVSLTGSDSSSLDNMLEVLRAGGMDVIQAMRILIPPAWQTVDNIDPDVRAFYEFWDGQQEPWDGPAGVVLTDGHGVPLAAVVTAGQSHESKSFETTLEAIRVPQQRRGRPRRRPRAVAADKAYSVRRIRRWLHRHKIEPVIPQRSNQVGRRGGHRKFDRAKYRRRNVVERCVSWLKDCRRVATRYEKLALNYLGMVDLAIVQRLLRLVSRCRTLT